MQGGVPYCGVAPLPAELLQRWNPDPLLLVALAAIVLVRVRWWRAEAPRTDLCFAAGIAALVLAFVSPLCALSSALFSARVVHHVLLVGVAAPLLVLGWPQGHKPAVRLGGLALLLHVVTLWFWHAPMPYEAALASDTVYWVMELTLLGSAVWFWQVVLRAPPSSGWSFAALLGAMVQMGLLGALITFAPRALYTPHFLTTEPFGLTALEDQQLAGLIMWVPAALPYLLAALLRLAGLLGGRQASAERVG